MRCENVEKFKKDYGHWGSGDMWVVEKMWTLWKKSWLKFFSHFFPQLRKKIKDSNFWINSSKILIIIVIPVFINKNNAKKKGKSFPQLVDIIVENWIGLEYNKTGTKGVQ